MLYSRSDTIAFKKTWFLGNHTLNLIHHMLMTVQFIAVIEIHGEVEQPFFHDDIHSSLV